MDPVTYPVIHLPVVGDPNKTEPFTVFFSIDAITLLLSQHKIDIFQQPENESLPDRLSRTCKLLSAGVSHIASISPEEMRKRVDISNLADIAAAVNRAISKVSTQVPTIQSPETPIQ